MRRTVSWSELSLLEPEAMVAWDAQCAWRTPVGWVRAPLASVMGPYDPRRLGPVLVVVTADGTGLRWCPTTGAWWSSWGVSTVGTVPSKTFEMFGPQWFANMRGRGHRVDEELWGP